MRRMEAEEFRETVERLEKEKEGVRGSLEEAVRERNRMAKELLEASAEKKTLSKWGIETLKGGTGWPRSFSRSRQGTRHWSTTWRTLYGRRSPT